MSFFSSRRRHTRYWRDWSSDVCSSDLSTQGAFMARQGIAELLGLPLDRVRVQAAPLGGAFGGKLMISEPLAAAAALGLRRPVQIGRGPGRESVEVSVGAGASKKKNDDY